MALREQFDYDKYPLGRQQIWILLWHPDFQHNVYLEPDLESYTTLDPAALPGLDKDVVLENWKLQRSFFSFRDNRYNTAFGVQGYAPQEKQPELYFNVSIKRHLLDVVVSRAIVPLVILIQLFVLVMVMGTNQERLDKFGVHPGGIIFTCAAFCFAVLLAQNSLRNELEAGGLVYFESLYILTYLVILAVALNSVLLVSHPNSKLFRDHDNLWAKVVYWPAVLLACCRDAVDVFLIAGRRGPPPPHPRPLAGDGASAGAARSYRLSCAPCAPPGPPRRPADSAGTRLQRSGAPSQTPAYPSSSPSSITSRHSAYSLA